MRIGLTFPMEGWKGRAFSMGTGVMNMCTPV